MAIDQGMNIAEVSALGEQLKGAAREINSVIQLLQTRVGATSWVGADSSRFKNDWWPGHRQRLQKIGVDLDGFGQSALNNASEQEQASGAGGTSGPGQAATPPQPIGDGWAAPRGAVTPQGRDWQDVKQKYDQWAAGAERRFSDPNDSQYQCTAWANFRWHELGYNGPAIGGNGGAMAANAPGELVAQPTLHAMASYGAGTEKSPGHVMIVEEVLGDGNKIRISEMNVSPDGDWVHAAADEYRDGRVITRSADGSWHGPRGETIMFAPLPTS